MVKIPLTQAVQELCDTQWTVERKTIRAIKDYAVSADGTVTPSSPDSPVLPPPTFTAGTGADGAGNDYQFTFPAGSLVNPKAWVEVAGDVNTGTGAGINANAVIPQNVRFSGNVLTVTLYTGDDGGGVDDARRRDLTLFVATDEACIADVFRNGVALSSQ